MLLLSVFSLASAAGIVAQPTPTHFSECYGSTGNNAIVVASETSLLMDGRALEPGDEVAVFTPAGLCAGVVTWDGEGMALAVWADDPMTAPVDGFVSGEPLAFAVYDASARAEHRGVTATYGDAGEASGTFAVDAVYLLEGLTTSPTADGPTAGPLATALGPNYPNPFRDQTTLTFDLETDADVQLEVFNVLGQRVAVVLDERRAAGHHEVTFDGAGLSAGAYIYHLRAGAFVATRRMLIAR